MFADLRFSAIVLAIGGMAVLSRGLPRLLEKSPTAELAKVEPSAPLPEAPSGLTTILPDGYKLAEDGETLIPTDAPSPIIDGDASLSQDEKATLGKGVPIMMASDPVLPSDPADAVAEPGSLAMSPASTSPAPRPEPKGASEGEIVTEFVPYVEKEPAGEVDAAPDLKEFRKARAHEPLAASASERAARVRSYEVPIEKVKDGFVPEASSAKGNPIHPYFRRYLDRKRYFVRSGDTFESIAERLYQDPQMAESLRRANPSALGDAGAPRPGVTLRLP